MKNQRTIFGIFIALAFVIFACNSTTTEAYHEETAVETEVHKVVVEEVLHTSVYTYLFVNENGNKVWIAVPKREVNTGETYYYEDGFEMPDFESKELKRTFDKLYLIAGISKTPDIKKSSMMMKKPTGKKPPGRGVVAKISHTDDEVTIAEIFTNMAHYDHKTVKVRGTVVKVNEQILGKNWVHIQDGTEYEGNFDLTITTGEQVKMGDVVGFEGTIVLNKDFGAGYVYDVIMENATVESTTRL